MKLTRAANYALHAAAYMAAQRGDQPLASHTIAAERGIPERFLLKVLKHLVSAGVLLSIKGPRGGYQLARSPAEITMLEIVEAVDGPILGVAPPLKKHDETSLSPRVEEVCREAAEQTVRVFSKVRLSQLVGKLRATAPGSNGSNGTNGASKSASGVEDE